VTPGPPEERRTQLQLHYQLVGILLAAGEDGVSVSMLGRMLFSPAEKPRGAYESARSLLKAASAALPIFETDDECVGLDLDTYVLRMQRSYRIPVDACPECLG
jgi:hypothetical protein